MTDSSDQVAGFSSRGQRGHRHRGRFWPVQAGCGGPGHLCGFDRSGQWDTNAYYNPTSHIYFTYQDVLVATNQLYCNSIFVPDNAVQLNLTRGAQYQFAGAVSRPAHLCQASRHCPTNAAERRLRRHQPRSPCRRTCRLESGGTPIGITRSAIPPIRRSSFRSGYRHRGHQRPGQLPPGAGRDE